MAAGTPAPAGTRARASDDHHPAVLPGRRASTPRPRSRLPCTTRGPAVSTSRCTPCSAAWPAGRSRSPGHWAPNPPRGRRGGAGQARRRRCRARRATRTGRRVRGARRHQPGVADPGDGRREPPHPRRRAPGSPASVPPTCSRSRPPSPAACARSRPSPRWPPPASPVTAAPQSRARSAPRLAAPCVRRTRRDLGQRAVRPAAHAGDTADHPAAIRRRRTAPARRPGLGVELDAVRAFTRS